MGDATADPLDLFQPISPSKFYGNKVKTAPSISAPAPRRSARPRKATGRLAGESKSATTTTKAASAPYSLRTNKPKRVYIVIDDDDDIEQSPPPPKKAKVEVDSTLSIVNAKRNERDRARNVWLLRNRHLFEMLLSSTRFFDALVQEQGKTDTKYSPLHQLDQQPSLIQGGEMKDYQLEGLSFLAWMYKSGMNCILGDEMGLGKTLQTLSLFAYLKEDAQQGHVDPHLVICPLSVLSSWQNEAARWVPSFKTVPFYGVKAERDRLKHLYRNGDFDLMLTTYENFVADDGWFKSRRWTYCVLDEGHRIKNSETNLAHKVQGIGSLYRLLLTGTPVQNNLSELWGLLHWLYPAIFTEATEKLFKNAFDLTKGAYSIPFMNASQALLSTIMLRRTKAHVELDVPPREELTVFIPMSEAQRFWTYRILTRMNTNELKTIFSGTVVKKEEDEPKREDCELDGRREVLSQLENHMREPDAASGKDMTRYKHLMNLLVQLRRVCDHPYLLSDAEPEPYYIGEHLVASSSKLVAIDKLLADLLPKGEQVLIFSQWTGMLDLLEDFMHLRSIRFARLDGQTARPRRTLDIRLFQKEESPYKVFLISTRAGGLGINLTKASAVIMVDSDWNPQIDLQAIARAHRIGQKKIVKVYRLICRGSVEDQMLDRIRRKLYLSIKLMGSDNASQTENAGMGMTELMDILRKGSSALSNTADDGSDFVKFLDAPIGEILDASRGRENARDAKVKKELEGGGRQEDSCLVQDAEEEQKRLLAGVAQVQARLFEGKMVQSKPSKNRDIADEWRNLQKRARVDRTVVIAGMNFVVDPINETVAVPAKVEKQKKEPFEWEDWCIECRDGGELICCQVCPRVFHAGCGGYTAQAAKRLGGISCPQHHCNDCQRSAQEAGGMLFRCRTCSNAFCEDCLPQENVELIDDIIPEFLLLKYPQKSNAYFIRCDHCHERAKQDVVWQKEWQMDMELAEKRWAEESL